MNHNNDSNSLEGSCPANTQSLPFSSDPFFQHDAWGSDHEYWVTVYGFPTNAKSYILQHFQSLGDVLNYSSSEVTGGNWLHLRYHTRLQAEKALTLNGKTLINRMMIGVKKCLPSEVEGVRQEPISKLYFSSHKSPGATYVHIYIFLNYLSLTLYVQRFGS